jgi:hypothetical protein
MTRKSAAISLSNGATLVDEKGGLESKKALRRGIYAGRITRFRIRIGAQYRTRWSSIAVIKKNAPPRASYNATLV